MPQVGSQFPSGALVGGNSVREPILQGYVFQSGIHDPEVSSILTYKYPQYYLTSLLDRLGAEESISQDVFSWFVMDRTREGSTIEAVDTALPAATVVADTNFDWSATSKGYLLVGDLIRVESGAILRVTATGDNGSGKQEITVVKQSGGNITAADLAANDTFGHISSAFGEASDAPEGRLYLPTEEFNTIQRIRRSFEISGSELTNRTYLNGGEAWYFEKEEIEMMEFARDKEAAVMFSELSLTEPKSMRGLYSYAKTYGVNTGYASATGVTETDLQDHIALLLKQNVSNDIVVLCGATFLKDVQIALKDYQQGGGTFGEQAGLDFQSYKFMGKTVHFAYYELFEDTSIVPTPARTPLTSDVINFSDFSLWVDMGTDNGRSLITLKYKELGGVSRKFIHAYEKGLISPNGVGGEVSNGKDAFKIHYFTECGLEVRLPNRLGILAATS